MDTKAYGDSIATNNTPTQPNDDFYNPSPELFQVGKILIFKNRKFRVRKITAKDIVLREVKQ